MRRLSEVPAETRQREPPTTSPIFKSQALPPRSKTQDETREKTRPRKAIHRQHTAPPALQNSTEHPRAVEPTDLKDEAEVRTQTTESPPDSPPRIEPGVYNIRHTFLGQNLDLLRLEGPGCVVEHRSAIGSKPNALSESQKWELMPMEGDWLIQSVSRRGWYLTVDNLGPFLGLIITEYPAAWQIAIRYQGPEQVVIVSINWPVDHLYWNLTNNVNPVALRPMKAPGYPDHSLWELKRVGDPISPVPSPDPSGGTIIHEIKIKKKKKGKPLSEREKRGAEKMMSRRVEPGSV